jgi:two-component system, LuxR family, sensor kinase FixL
MSNIETARGRMTSAVLRYGLAVSSVAVALMFTFLLRPDGLVAPLFFLAIILTAWAGGKGPGLLAALLATLSIDYFFLEPIYHLKFDPAHLPQMLVFFVSAVLVSSWSAARKRAETLLRQARDEQEAKVQERTADLKQANENLQAEIADRKRVEETLRERAALLDLTHDTVFVRDLSDVITYWNRGAEEQYGWKREEATGQVTHQLTQTIFPAPLEEINAELLGTGRWEGELIHTKRDGTKVVVASRWSLQHDAQGNPLAILETNNDITERRQAEEALNKAQAELAHITRMMTMGELAASIAHEVNQPLTAVITNANACARWLSGQSPNLGEAREAISRIVRDGNRASEVIKRIRAMLKKTAPQKSHLDINEAIREIIALAQSEARRNRVLLTADLAAGLPPVLADRVQLQQVALNLIINGIEAMRSVTDRPRNLLVRTQRDESGHVMVSVQDSGTGIDPQNVDRLFDAFYTTKSEGMGMGLSISRSIIEAHGGQLWALANNGHGATLQFTLPANGGNHHN